MVEKKDFEKCNREMLSKRCVAFSTMVCRQLKLKEYLTLTIYSSINCIIGVFDQHYNFCNNIITFTSNNVIENFALFIFKVFASNDITFASNNVIFGNFERIHKKFGKHCNK